MNDTAISSIIASCGTLFAVSPLVVWSLDSLFSIGRVRDSTMEPTLFRGDVLVIRKADGFWQRLKVPTRDKTTEDERLTDNDKRAIERERVLAYERNHCNSNGYIGLLRKPPTPITGNIVVFKDPEKYPDEWNIKRAVALGGESIATVLSKPNPFQQKSDYESIREEKEEELSTRLVVMPLGEKTMKPISTAYVPPYCIWVEGDNVDKSLVSSSSRSHGPVSKKLLVGIAEFRLWPPWRVGKLDNKKPSGTSLIQ